MGLYDTLWETERFIGKILGIPKDTMSYVVLDYVIGEYLCIDGKTITDIEEVADIIIKDIEENTNVEQRADHKTN